MLTGETMGKQRGTQEGNGVREGKGKGREEEPAQAPLASPPVSPVIVSSAPKAAQAPKPVKVIKSTIPAHWIPTEATYALLEKNGIERPFAESCLDEFRLYWQERGESRPGWESTFVNSVKRQWARRTPHSHPDAAQRPPLPTPATHHDAGSRPL